MKTILLPIVLLFIQCQSQSQTGTIGLAPFGSGFSAPVEITHCGDSRLFILEQDGIIKILNANGTTNATPFLNITTLTNRSGEQGLLGLAFHPNYSTNGYFYVNYTRISDGATVNHVIRLIPEIQIRQIQQVQTSYSLFLNLLAIITEVL